MNFEEFYAAYPRKVGKKAAEKSWDKLIKMGTNPNEIIEGAKRYAAAKRGTDQQYIAHPATWLNAGRWQDEMGAPEPEEPAWKTDNKLVAQMQATRDIHRLRDNLIERTREHHRERIQEAARRLGIDEIEMWSCLLPGSDGIQWRAWAAASLHVLDNQTAPSALPIHAEHWISARDRNESRTKFGPKPKKIALRDEENVHDALRSSPKEDVYDDTAAEV